MPIPLAEILRDRPATAVAEPPPAAAPEASGVAPAPPAPPAAPAAPPSLEEGFGEFRRGADLRQQAVNQALARQKEIEGLRAQEFALHQQLAEPLQQRIDTLSSQPLPDVAAPPTLPEPPSLAVRPFLSGTPGEPPEQSLQRAVMGLSLLAQMGFGAAAGVPELSLRTLAGAMQGWQEGDIIRGDRDFKEWQGTVEQLQQDYGNRRQLVEDIVQRNRGDLERTRLALLTELARHGASMQELQALSESAQAYFNLMETQGKIVQDVGAMGANLAVQVLARQMDAAMKTSQMLHQRRMEEIAAAGEGRKAAAQEQTNALIARFLGGGSPAEPTTPAAPGAPGGTPPPGPSGQFDVVPSFGPGGASIRLEPKKIGETTQTALRTYDSILANLHDLKTQFSDAEIDQYAGMFRAAGKELQQGVGSLPGMGQYADPRYAAFKALVGRLTGTAFGEGGKQLTPFEASVVFSYTPTGWERGGATEFRAKVESLERFTKVRRALAAYYSEKGVDPTTVPTALWDQAMQQELSKAGVDFTATVRGRASDSAGGWGKARVVTP